MRWEVYMMPMKMRVMPRGKLCEMPVPWGVAVALGRLAKSMMARMIPCLATAGWEPLHSLAHVPFDLPAIARACFSLWGHS